MLVKDYYQFYSLIDIFTVEKNEDKSGIGIAMTNLDYLIHMTKSDYPNDEIVIRKIISMHIIDYSKRSKKNYYLSITTTN